MADPLDRTAQLESVMVTDPITIHPDSALEDALALMKKHAISALPVVEAGIGGRPGKLVGMLTSRDVRFASNSRAKVADLMTKDRLITVRDSVDMSEAKRLLHQHRIEKLLVVDAAYRCIGLITVKDIAKAEDRAEQIRTAIAESAKFAPTFEPSRGRIRYRQSPVPADSILERKTVAKQRCEELSSLCSIRANEQPQLRRLVDQYAGALAKLRKDRGAYTLFTLGLDIELFLRVRTEVPSDSERNPPLDGDLLFAARSLMIAHAGLVTLFPDIQHIAEELDRYRGQLDAVDALLGRRVLDSVLDPLAASEGILDDETKELTQKIRQHGEVAPLPSRAAISVKHAWLRGALAAIWPAPGLDDTRLS